MRAEIDQLLLILNIKAEPKETAYTLQTQYVYRNQYKKMIPRQTMLKFYKNKCINKIYINTNLDALNYLNNELKLYQ